MTRLTFIYALKHHHSSKRWLFLLLALALVLSVISPFLFHSGFSIAHAAAPTLQVSPSSGAYTNRDDQTPIVVSGSNFTPHEAVNVYWNYTQQNNGTLVATVNAGKDGSFSTSFLYQLAAEGNYTIAAIGQSSGDIATGAFTLLPDLYIRPQAGGPNTPVTFYGNAFGAGEQVNLYWMYNGPGTGTLLTTATANSTGSFAVTANIPAQKPRYYPVGAVGQTTQTVATYRFTLSKPVLMLAPLSGSAGTTLTISAMGFTGGELVDIFWNNHKNAIATMTTSPYGYIAPTSIPVPAKATPGAYPLKAVGRLSGITMRNTFTVLAPSSTLDLTSGPVGATVNLNGQGYTPNNTVNILWNYQGTGTGTSLGEVSANGSGIIQASFPVPAAANGSYQVAALDTATQNVTQNTFTINNSVAASPSTDTPDQQATINGTGFQPIETVNLYWDSTSNSVFATTAADASGNINQAVTIPAQTTPGAHTLIAVGQIDGATYTTPITINTNWGDFGFDYAHHRENIHEHILGTSNVANLQLRWTAQTAVGLKDSPVYANGTVYIGSMDGLLYAYDATTGLQKWAFDCHCVFRSYSSPLVDPANNLVFFGTVGYSNEGTPSPFYALDAQTGQLRWSEYLAWESVGFPTLAFNTLYIGTSHIDHNNCSLVAIDELTGAVKWQYVLNAGVWGAVAADTATNTVFTGVGNPLASVMAFNATTGAVVWQYNVPQYGADDDVGSGITLANGLVYASSKNGSVYALNESTGTLAWSTAISTRSAGNMSTQAVSTNGDLYVGTFHGDLVALNATTGQKLWSILTDGHMYSSPAVANGVVYAASFDNKLYAVDAASGAILWTYTMDAYSFASPIVVNGWLYCTAADGKVYAFSL